MKTQNFFGDRERVTGAVRNISSDHANIHDHEGFELCFGTEAVADDGTILIEIVTGSAKYVHMKHMRPWSEGGVASFDIVEGGTSTGGTGATPKDKNRNGTPSTSSVTVKTGVTPTGGTSIRDPELFGGGGPGSGAGGSASIENEWVLARSTNYLFRVKNLAGSAKALGLTLFWYEEEGA